MGARADSETQSWKIVLCGAGVGNIERAVLTHPTISWLINTDLFPANGYGAKMSPHNHGVPVDESQHHVIDPTHPSGALHDRIEHRLYVRRRPANDAEHLRCCSLMLQRLSELLVTFLRFFKSRVLSLQRFGELLA